MINAPSPSLHTKLKTGALTVVFVFYALFFAYTLYFYFSQIDGIHETIGSERLGRDFINFWHGGHLAASGLGAEAFDGGFYRQNLIKNFGEPLGDYFFGYPPHSFFFLIPFGVLPYRLAFTLWIFGGLTSYLWASRQFLLSWQALLVLMIAPASLICGLGGQTGFWTAGLLIGGLACLERRPVLAGILFGILTVKPQLGVLLAVALLAGGYWRVIISASVTTLLLGLASLTVFGLTPWVQFINDAMPRVGDVIRRDYGIFDYMVHTPFKFLINLDIGEGAALGFQLSYALPALLVTIWTFRQPGQLPLKAAILCMTTLLFSPYIAIYDMTIMSFAVMVFITNRGWNHIGWIALMLLLLVLSLPLTGSFASYVDIPLSIAVMPIFLFMLIRDLRSAVGVRVTTT